MKTLSDGIYVDLPEDEYFAQDRLGSTDLVRLHRSPADFWYASRHNPDRQPREQSPEMAFGSALHALVLEGEDAYAAKAVVSPFDSFRTKEAQLWRDEQEDAGRIIMTADMERRVRHMAQLILNHPELGPAFQGGMSELSVLFTLEGVPMRARFDKLLPSFLVDLKTCTGAAKGRDVKDRALRLIAERDYDVQRYAYSVARRRMADLVADGKVYGATPEQAEWLRQVAAVEDFWWVWVFFQRRDDKAGHAPVVMPIQRAPFDATFETGRRKVETALANYRHFVDRFGFDTPWALIEPLTTPEDHEFPSWMADTAHPVEAPMQEAAE